MECTFKRLKKELTMLIGPALSIKLPLDSSELDHTTYLSLARRPTYYQSRLPHQQPASSRPQLMPMPSSKQLKSLSMIMHHSDKKENGPYGRGILLQSSTPMDVQTSSTQSIHQQH